MGFDLFKRQLGWLSRFHSLVLHAGNHTHIATIPVPRAVAHHHPRRHFPAPSPPATPRSFGSSDLSAEGEGERGRCERQELVRLVCDLRLCMCHQPPTITTASHLALTPK